MSKINWLANFYASFADKDLAQFMVEGLNLDFQLIAIRGVLARNDTAEAQYNQQIQDLEKEARAAEGQYGDHLTDELVDRMHQGVYLDAAHSMAAVAMLAPFIESLFAAVFREIRRQQEKDDQSKPTNKRLKVSRDLFWNPHLTLAARDVKEDLIRGIDELATATELARFLPAQYLTTLRALFAYRNRMVHLGMEWPMEDRLKFAEMIRQQKWPEDWFLTATSGDKPWVFYMSRSFIDHCLATVDDILGGIGAFVREQAVSLDDAQSRSSP